MVTPEPGFYFSISAKVERTPKSALNSVSPYMGINRRRVPV
jgi:hypothetical protein